MMILISWIFFLYLNQVDDENDISNEPNAEEIIESKIGMVFDATQDLFEFYKMYAKIMGFKIIKRTSSKGDDGELKYVTFSCSRKGDDGELHYALVHFHFHEAHHCAQLQCH